jgi:hemolysin-activating ACP:hemolysin acyltransferase
MLVGITGQGTINVMNLLDYDYEKDGMLSYVPFDHTDFYDMVYLWSTANIYKDYICNTIGWRLMPAFENRRAIIFKRDINTVGLALWGWMTKEEYETDEYSGEEVFSRESGEYFVLSDMILPNDNAMLAVRHLRHFAKTQYPEADRIYFDRPNRKSNVRINP